MWYVEVESDHGCYATLSPGHVTEQDARVWANAWLLRCQVYRPDTVRVVYDGPKVFVADDTQHAARVRSRLDRCLSSMCKIVRGVAPETLHRVLSNQSSDPEVLYRSLMEYAAVYAAVIRSTLTDDVYTEFSNEQLPAMMLATLFSAMLSQEYTSLMDATDDDDREFSLPF
jgi:hypothetical protein